MLTLIKKKNPRNIGNQYEILAENYLKKSGLHTVERNYFSPMGEIDLVMTDESVLVFVEVRFRTASQFSSAVETVSAAKKRKIILTAEFFLINNKQYQFSSCRFDVIGIDKTNSGELQINWIKHAFME